jgi:hypothetical protein
MMNQPLRTLMIILIAATSILAAKPLNWQTGKVLDTQRNRYYASTGDSGNTSGSATTTDSATTAGSVWSSHSSTAVYRVFETFVIEGEDYAYVANERLRWRWSHSANLAANGPVKYAVDGHKLIVIDDDGKQHEMEIVKRILKPKDAANQPNVR